jgi:hypothetical protein
MTTITRSTFRDTLDNGIDLNSPDLAGELDGTGVSIDDLHRADANGDGIISGPGELNRAFNLVDGVDHNGHASSFENAGAAGTVFAALSKAERPAPNYGGDIAEAAAARVASDGPNYADDRAPTSPLVGLSGNTHPGVSRPSWLTNESKCNQFAGDSLTQAGVQAPMVTMANGSLHYARAEKWPGREDLFDRITDPDAVKIGDVVVKDYPGTGEATAHVEIVTGVNPFKSTGAHWNGASEKNVDLLAGTTYDPANHSFDTAGGDQVYVLRPKKRIDE